MATKVWTGFLQFGLLNIPIFLNTCARDKKIEMHNYHVACNGPISMPKFCAACNVHLQPTEIYRGYARGKGEGVVPITDKELDEITPQTGHVAEITECVKWSQVDPSLLAESFFIVPDDAGRKGYSLLAKVLRDSNLVAIAQLTKNGREHVVVVRPKGAALMLHYLWYEGEIKKVPEFETFAPVALSAQEIKLGTQLAQSMESEFEHSKFEDSYSMRLTTLISSKLDKSIQPPVPVRASAPAVADIMSALQESLAQPKKPSRRITLQEEPAAVAAAPKGKKAKGKKAA